MTFFYSVSWVREWHPPEQKKILYLIGEQIEHYKQCNHPGFTETNDKLNLQSLSVVLYHNSEADVRTVGLVGKIEQSENKSEKWHDI